MFPIFAAGSAEPVRLPAFVVARDGLYLRKQSLLGLSQTKVPGAAHLPVEKEYVEYTLPKVPMDLMARAVGFFRHVYRVHRSEAVVLLTWTAEGFGLFLPEQKVGSASVKHSLHDSELVSGARVVGSIHSHGAFGAGASSVDEDDEAEFDGLHVVVGDFDRRRQSYSAAIAVDGHRFEVRSGVVLERPGRLVQPPDDWLKRVKLLPPPRPARPKTESTGSNGAAAPVPKAHSRPSRIELDVALARAGRLADELGYRLSYWLVPVSGSAGKGGGADG
ncbi:MAG: hypothetical protein H0X16_11555 [Chloroflexi bacterium]|nr:hypothetical protein [Chloroflexota bacterium]HEV8054189.1 hypothetical protein [Candidatus Limnocylindrales bacterium]